MVIVKWMLFWGLFAVLIAGIHIYKPFATWGVDSYIIADPLGTSGTVVPAARASDGADDPVAIEAALEQEIADVPVAELPSDSFELGMSKPEQIARLARESLDGTAGALASTTVARAELEASRELAEQAPPPPSSSQTSAPQSVSSPEAQSAAPSSAARLESQPSESASSATRDEAKANAGNSGPTSAAIALPQVYETTTPLNFRAGPGRDFRLLGTLDGATRVQVIEEQDGWFRIRTKNDSPAYVRAKYLVPID